MKAEYKKPEITVYEIDVQSILTGSQLIEKQSASCEYGGEVGSSSMEYVDEED